MIWTVCALLLSCTNTRCWAAAKSDKAAFHTAGSHPAEKAIKAYRGSLLMAHARSYTCLPPNASEHWQYCCIICNTQVHQSRSRSAYTRQSTERTHTGRVSPVSYSYRHGHIHGRFFVDFCLVESGRLFAPRNGPRQRAKVDGIIVTCNDCSCSPPGN